MKRLRDFFFIEQRRKPHDSLEDRSEQLDRRIERSEDMLRRAAAALNRAQQIEAQARVRDRKYE